MREIHRGSAPLVASAVFALAACSGGGGGGGTTNTIEASDARDLAQVTTSITALLGVTDFATDMFGGGMTVVGYQGISGGTEISDCTGGGTVSYTFTDVPPTSELSAGDSYTVDFDACVEGKTTFDGSFGFTVDELVETATTASIALTFSIGPYTLMDPGASLAQDGVLSEALEVDTETGSFGYSVAGFFNTSYTEGGETLTANLTGLDVGFDYLAEFEVQALRFNCTYESSVDLDVDFTVTTISDFVAYGQGANPTEGQASIAAGGDTLYLTAQEDGLNVLLELDQGTDGSIDYTELVPWDEL